MRDTCVYCGVKGSNFVPEHWVPKWLSRALVPKRLGGVIHFAPDAPSFGIQARGFEHTVRHVCTTCNNGWLSTIESQAKRHVLPFVLGTAGARTMTAAGLEHVARWGYLKAISLELGRPNDLTQLHSAQIYADFRREKQPPFPNCSLALGVRDFGDEPHPIFVWWESHSIDMETEPPFSMRFTGYQTVLIIGCVVVSVIGTQIPVTPDVDHGQGFNVLWPTIPNGGEFQWPPKHRFTCLTPDGFS
jgi:hypothetical protein